MDVITKSKMTSDFKMAAVNEKDIKEKLMKPIWGQTILSLWTLFDTKSLRMRNSGPHVILVHPFRKLKIIISKAQGVPQ